MTYARLGEVPMLPDRFQFVSTAAPTDTWVAEPGAPGAALLGLDASVRSGGKMTSGMIAADNGSSVEALSPVLLVFSGQKCSSRPYRRQRGADQEQAISVLRVKTTLLARSVFNGVPVYAKNPQPAGTTGGVHRKSVFYRNS